MYAIFKQGNEYVIRFISGYNRSGINAVKICESLKEALKYKEE